MRPASWLALTLSLASPVLAADGELDPTFGTNGQVVFGLGLGPAHARDAASSAAGLVVVGDDEAAAGNFDFRAERLAADGSVVGSSGPIAFDLVAGGDDFAMAVAPAPGGKVLIAGTVDVGGGVTVLGIVRLVAATMALDPTFDSDGVKTLGLPGRTHYNPDLAVLADGSILIGFTYADPVLVDSDFGVFKLLPDGLRDSSFGSSGFAGVAFNLGGDGVDIFRALAVQPDGRIVLAGSGQWSATDFDFVVARLLPGGGLDPGFGPFGTGRSFVAFDLDANATDLGAALAIAPDGRIALAGYASSSPVAQGAVAVLYPSGHPDLTFDGDGKRLVAWIGGAGANDLTGAEFESDGALFLSGNAYAQLGSQGNLGVTRLLPSGAYDCSFYGCFHMYDLDPAWEYTHRATLEGGRPLLIGTRDGDWALVRLTNALVFRDGFESGVTFFWSATF